MKKLICKCENHGLVQGGDNFYYVLFPDNTTMVDMMGSKDEVITELKRWKKEVDSNNSFMLKIENAFINCLESR